MDVGFGLPVRSSSDGTRTSIPVIFGRKPASPCPRSTSNWKLVATKTVVSLAEPKSASFTRALLAGRRGRVLRKRAVVTGDRLQMAGNVVLGNEDHPDRKVHGVAGAI